MPDEDGKLWIHERGKNGYSTGSVSLKDKELTDQKQSTNNSLTVKEHPDSLIPDSLIPDTGLLGSTAQAPASDKPKRTRKSQKIPLPDGFCVSEQVNAWAVKNNVQNLDRHFSSFIDKAKANGYVYADWDAALRNAISGDWAKLGGQHLARGSPKTSISRHNGFDQKDYGEGIGDDGCIH